MPKHLLGIEGMDRDELYLYLRNAQSFVEVSERELKKVPPLRGKTIVNMFLESSTRTRVSFEIAGKRLSADTVNIGSSDSSITKGETLFDTVHTLQAMAPDIIVMRHKESGSPHFVAQHLKRTSVVNAGDGTHEHPSQALLDCLTLLNHFGQRGIENLTIAIVGDIVHSRVARSNIWAHLALGNRVRLVGPPPLIPDEFLGRRFCDGRVEIVHDLRSGIEGADVVMVLRMQLERQEDRFVPSLEEYSNEYCVSERVLAACAPSSVVLHPGPANRGLEISSEVLDGPRSLYRKQVNYGVAVRMAVLFNLGTGLKEVNS